MYPMKNFNLKGLCVLQSNNFREDVSHINCVDNLEEFKEQSGLTQIDYEGEIPFHHLKDNYKRFMLIGRK
jgi:hypothetical protein